MNADDSAQLIYLALLGGAIVMWFFSQNRASLGKVTQQALVWAFIFIGVIAVVGLWGDIRQTVSPGHAVRIEGEQIIVPRASDGHYYLQADINGKPVVFVVDTGATEIVLTQADAKRAGIDTNDLTYIGRANTANGTVSTAPVRLDSFSIGPVEHHGIRAVVNGGQMEGSLLGMSYLQRFNSIEITGGRLVLTP